jgi:hypothetical protein
MGDTAFDGSKDYDATGKLDKDHVMRSKLAVETMQWQMARLNPRRWQERKHIDTSVQASIAEMTVEQRQAMVQGMLKRLKIIARPAIEEERKRLEAQQAKIIDVTPKLEPAPVAAPKKRVIGG